MSKPRLLPTAKPLLLPVLILCLISVCSGQITAEQVRKILVEKALFSEADLAAVDRGDTVVKLVPVQDNKEVSVCGVVRLQNSKDVSMTAFRESLTQKGNKAVTGSGKFSTPPKFEDFQALKLDGDDIKDLRKCEIHDCDVRLPAAMIKRFRSEVDWDGTNYEQQAAQMYKQFLIDYVGDYARRGDDALMQYDSRKTPVRLADEYPILLSKSLFISELAPELVRYLREFPKFQLSGVEDSLDWSRVDFGLDPTITITHTANFARSGQNDSLLMIAAKQIYANRYLDSSLALTMLVTVQGANGYESYLIFTDRSRSNVLDGMFSGTKRKMVGEESAGRVTDVLSRAKLRLTSDTSSQAAITNEVEDVGKESRIWQFVRHPVTAISLIVLAFLAIVIVALRFANRDSAEAE